MAAPDFSQVDRADRDKLSRLLGTSDLAQRFWEEAVRPIVDSADRYGMSSKNVYARRSQARHGMELERHMEKVNKTAKALRKLLDEDTLFQLFSPSSNVLWADNFGARQDRNVHRIRDLRRLLDELSFEIEIPRTDPRTGDTKSLARWGATVRVDSHTSEAVCEPERAPLQHRLDCFLASSAVRWVNAEPSVQANPASLLDVVFTVLKLNTDDIRKQSATVYRGVDSIRDAKARKLIP